MRQSVPRTLRYLARLISQETARANASEGSATLRSQRQDQEEADEYLRARPGTATSGRAVHGAR